MSTPLGSSQWMYSSGEEVTQQSLKFNDDESQYLSWTPAAAGNRKTWTWSGWVKRGNFSQNFLFSAGADSNNRVQLSFENYTSDNLSLEAKSGGSTQAQIVSTATYRDPSAWYHVVIAVDTTEATSTNRIKFFVNGLQATDLQRTTYPSQNADLEINKATEHTIGKRSYSANYFDGYLSDIHFIDGQALDASSFGQFTNGYWKAKDYAGTYGTNGFHLTFQDDVVSEGFNAVTYAGNGSTQSISGLGFEPDLVWFKVRNQVNNHYLFDTIRGADQALFSDATSGETDYSATGRMTSFDADGFTVKYSLSTGTNASGSTYVAWAWDAGDVTSIVTNGDFSNGTTGWTANNCTASVNSDGRLSATYSSSGAYVYQLLTTVVGQTYAITYNNYQAADFVFVHATSPTGTLIASSNSSGTAPVLFTATTTTTSIRFDIPSSQTRIIDDVQVFEANTDGSITSTVKANPDYGFSIVSYTGTFAAATVGHGLSSAPELIIVKNRSTTTNWWVGSDALGGWDKYLGLDLASAVGTATSIWNGTAPTSTVFSVADDGGSNGSGNSIVAYCFNSVAGYSSIGSYSGNGSTSGPTITTGFEPAWIMIKRTDSGNNWVILDTTRDPDGQLTKYLVADYNQSESDSTQVQTQVDATGFTLKSGFDIVNASGGTYIYMAFADTREAAFWKDVSGQGNHWTPNNLDYRDSLIDSPANNFAVLNPLASLGGMTFFEGNTKVRHADIGSYNHARSTMGMTTGKWYWEWYNSGSSGDAPTQLSGIVNDAVPVSTSNGYVGQNANGYSYSESGVRYHNASNIGTISVPTGDSSGIWMLAYDADDGKLYVGKNGTWANSGNPAAGTGALFTGIDTDTTWYPAGYTINNDGGRWRDIVVNHGQDSTFSGARPAGGNTDANNIGDFAYAPPSGYLALCTANLPTPSIVDGSEHFNTVLYTGNASTNAVTGVGFDLSADGGLVWMKNRASAYFHGLYDSVRGTGITKSLYSNATDAEGANSTNQNLVSFDSDGFTLGSTTGTNAINTSGQSHAAWNWKAGGTAVSNTSGSITSSVSANVDAGFSVVSWTNSGFGYTVGHGLGTEPDLILHKCRSNSSNWQVYSSALGTGKGLILNSTSAAASASGYWPSVTSTTFEQGDQMFVGGTHDFIAYCFANTEGYLKAGSYVGNGSADGTFVYTGFRPAWVMIKYSNGSQDWTLFDSKREGFNETDKYLHPSASAAEGDYDTLEVDLLSNGFKCRGPYNHINASGGTYIYLAFAENPFKYANAR